MKPLQILFTASEAEPLVKVGGLADVAGSLPRALQELSPEMLDGNQFDVRLVLPLHPAVRLRMPEPDVVAHFSIPSDNGSIPAQVLQTKIHGICTYLISGPPIPVEAPVYSKNIEEDAIKYAFFSLATLELVRRLKWEPDILHANDWHTATSVYMLKLLREVGDPLFSHTRSVLTIHNLPFMGAGSERALTSFGVPPSTQENLPKWARLMPLPLGLLASDHIVAVSPTYAQEIMTPEFGCDLQTFLQSRKQKISGILNGIDQDDINPATDPALDFHFTSDTLSERQKNKQVLLNEFSLNYDPSVPLMIMIGRMDQQKGVDLLIAALNLIKDLSWQVLILGSGNLILEQACRGLQEDLPAKVRAIIRYDARLARRMLSAGDIVLMPSRYEPCGLVQMNAMRYGCLPLARATGGLKDTIIDYSDPESTGFLFGKPDTVELAETIRRALTVFKDQFAWQTLQKRAMAKDFSWRSSALEYANLYLKLQKEVG